MFGYKLKMKVECKNIFLYVSLQAQNESRVLGTFSIFLANILEPCTEIWRFLFTFWLNSGYRKSQKALDFSTLKNLIDFWLYTYIYTHSPPPPPRKKAATHLRALSENCRQFQGDSCRGRHAQNLPTKPTTGTQKFPTLDFLCVFRQRITTVRWPVLEFWQESCHRTSRL